MPSYMKTANYSKRQYQQTEELITNYRRLYDDEMKADSMFNSSFRSSEDKWIVQKLMQIKKKEIKKEKYNNSCRRIVR